VKNNISLSNFLSSKYRLEFSIKNVFPLSKASRKPFFAKRIARKSFWWVLARERKVSEINSRFEEVRRKVIKGQLPLNISNSIKQ